MREVPSGTAVLVPRQTGHEPCGTADEETHPQCRTVHAARREQEVHGDPAVAAAVGALHGPTPRETARDDVVLSCGLVAPYDRPAALDELAAEQRVLATTEA